MRRPFLRNKRIFLRIRIFGSSTFVEVTGKKDALDAIALYEQLHNIEIDEADLSWPSGKVVKLR